MKRLALMLYCLALPALAADKWVGEINSSAGASTTNVSTATPFVILSGARYSIQCSQNVNITFASTSAAAPVATTVSIKMFFLAVLPAIYDICTYDSSTVWAIIPVTAGSATCEVFRVPMLPGSCS